VQRRAAVSGGASPGKRVNGLPTSVSSGDCTGSKRASQGIDLEALGVAVSGGAWLGKHINAFPALV
jgi:hypothetical protein